MTQILKSTLSVSIPALSSWEISEKKLYLSFVDLKEVLLLYCGISYKANPQLQQISKWSNLVFDKQTKQNHISAVFASQAHCYLFMKLYMVFQHSIFHSNYYTTPFYFSLFDKRLCRLIMLLLLWQNSKVFIKHSHFPFFHFQNGKITVRLSFCTVWSFTMNPVFHLQYVYIFTTNLWFYYIVVHLKMEKIRFSWSF